MDGALYLLGWRSPNLELGEKTAVGTEICMQLLEVSAELVGSHDRLPRTDVSKSIRKITKFVSLKHRFIYLPVPKAGTQTVLTLLERVHNGEGDRIRINEGLDTIFEHHPKWRDFRRFSVVRHPFTRLVSCYIDKILDFNEDKRSMLTKAGMDDLPGSFCEFVDFVCSERGQDRRANSHWGSQNAILCDVHGSLAVDMVGRLETLDEDLARIFESLGIETSGDRYHKNQRDLHLADKPAAVIDDERYWTAPIERRLMDRFQLDYELFGYGPFRPLN